MIAIDTFIAFGVTFQSMMIQFVAIFECAYTNGAFELKNDGVLLSLMIPKSLLGFEWFWLIGLTIPANQRVAMFVVRFQLVDSVQFHFAYLTFKCTIHLLGFRLHV